MNGCTVRSLLFLAVVMCCVSVVRADKQVLLDSEQAVYHLDEKTRSLIRQYTWSPGCPVPISDLRIVRFNFITIKHKRETGALIVHKNVAEEVLQIFMALAHNEFPLVMVKPMYHFKGDDNASMQANNTSAFNCRLMTGSKTKYSKHSYGVAVDINPLFNPYIKGHVVIPTQAAKYVQRRQSPGLIMSDSFVVKLFQDAGWRWGGQWRSLKDYQHFEKVQNW